MPLQATLTVALNAKQTLVGDLGTNAAPVNTTKILSLADGAGAGQANRMFADTRQLAASGTEDLDLAGVLEDAFGAVLTFARIKALLFIAHATNVNNVIVSRPASAGVSTLFSAASDAIILRPGAFLALGTDAADATGYAVTATTADLFTVTNSAGGSVVDYDVVIIGAAS